MNDQSDEGHTPAPSLSEARGSSAPGKNPAIRLLWIAGALWLAIAAALGGWLYFKTRYTLQPLRADANTLYLANWSKNVDGWSGGSQWHWKQPGVISSVAPPNTFYTPLDSLFFLAPYYSSGADAHIEVDAQIKSLDWGSTFASEGPVFGIVVGVNSHYNGYLCSGVPQFLSPLGSAAGVTGYAGIDEAHVDFTHYVNFAVKIQNHVVTLSINGQQAAQGTLPDYQAGGSFGLYSIYGAIEVQGFRIERLP